MKLGERTYRQASCRITEPEGLPKEMRDGIREVVSLRSENPRKGHATALMHQIVTEADFSGTVLILMPQPFGDGMTQEQLEKWYGRFGFVTVQTEPAVLMARQAQRLKINGLQRQH